MAQRIQRRDRGWEYSVWPRRRSLREREISGRAEKPNGNLIRAAINWWCPERTEASRSEQEADNEEREAVREALRKMMEELYLTYQIMVRRLPRFYWLTRTHHLYNV